MTNEQRILGYLRRISPQPATNAELARYAEVRPHQQVFQITQRLLIRRIIRGVRDGHEWRFWIENVTHEEGATSTQSPPPPIGADAASLSAVAFERFAQRVMGAHYGMGLLPGQLSGVPKRFDMISEDRTVVGDAKYFSLVRGVSSPPAKFSVIAEHVWLLEKTGASHKFLVFGNQREVPARWLERYGKLCGTVEFFFLQPDGQLERLA